ncbi:MAG TPA: hypothetical protein VFX74_03085 [Candidatus Limnocylindria bacterium]|nr:hypothetical protein [Candidatus Limnocylindria bacterium]
MESSKTAARPKRPRRAALNWLDYLVLAATILTFFAVVAANSSHGAHAQGNGTLMMSSELPDQPDHAPLDAALIGMRIKLATSQL